VCVSCYSVSSAKPGCVFVVGQPTPPTPPTPPENPFVCNVTSFQCESVAKGTAGGVEKATCDEQCIMPPPDPVTPINLIGTWRGIGIQNGYKFGEWDVVSTTCYL
jgi:hypothetical protein